MSQEQGELPIARLTAALAEISVAREARVLEPGHAPATLMSLIDLTQRLRERADLWR